MRRSDEGIRHPCPQALASALSKMQAEIKDLRRFLDDLTKHSEWEDVVIEARGMNTFFRAVQEARTSS